MIRKIAPMGMMALVAAAPAKVDMAARVLPPPAAPGETVAPFVSVPAGRIALVHVGVIDGTGAARQPDRTVLVDGGKITAVLSGSDPVPEGYRIIDGGGQTVLPGLVMMHEHQYYIAAPNRSAAGPDEPLLLPQMTFSSPRMYLAGGVTTLRTAGSVEPYTDLAMKAAIDGGKLPGPHMDVTGPYLEGKGTDFIQMHPLADAGEAAQMVDYWADRGVTSFKAYMNITRAELKAAIGAAHARGLKLTGHLCSVTYPEAAELGIDNLEHGFVVNTQLDPGKQADQCPQKEPGDATLAAMTPGSEAARSLIALLVARKVAVTSTLPVFEYNGTPFVLPAAQLAMLTPEARVDYLQVFLRIAARTPERKAVKAQQWANELAMEKAFVDAGGLLLAGSDPTGAGEVLPGFGDQREVELLVSAGFTPEQAIRIATLNGATYLGLADRIGSIAPGKNADLVLVRGDPSVRIADIENVVTVFKDGTGYDSAKLLDSVRGRYGQY